jgi:lysophospholipase L1-like esterase
MRKGGLYLALGDSTTWTIPVPYAGDNGTMLTSYRLWQWINQNYAPIKYVNKGIGGLDSTGFTHLQWQLWALRLQPDIVTVQIGMNDCNNDAVGTTNYQNNLLTLIKLLRSHNPNVLIYLCAPNQTTDPNRTPYVQNYRNAMQQTATANNVGFLDFSQAFTNGQCSQYCENNAGPYVHPSGAGHGLIFNNVVLPTLQTDSKFLAWANSLG